MTSLHNRASDPATGIATGAQIGTITREEYVRVCGMA